MFKSKMDKEIEKKMLVKKTISNMNKQINTLERQKQVFLDKAVLAKKNGLTAQYDLAVTAYKQTALQQRRAQEMLLNFEITSQMKDMTMMTKEFLGSMSVLSREMAKLADDKEFNKVRKEFEYAMGRAEYQAEQMDMFMEESQDKFKTSSGDTNAIDDKEIKDFIDRQINAELDSEDSLDADIDELRKKINSQS